MFLDAHLAFDKATRMKKKQLWLIGTALCIIVVVLAINWLMPVFTGRKEGSYYLTIGAVNTVVTRILVPCHESVGELPKTLSLDELISIAKQCGAKDAHAQRQLEILESRSRYWKQRNRHIRLALVSVDENQKGNEGNSWAYNLYFNGSPIEIKISSD